MAIMRRSRLSKASPGEAAAPSVGGSAALAWGGFSDMGTSGFFQIPDAHALRVGRLLAEWSVLELALEDLIWALSGLDHETGRLFTSRLDVRPKIEILDGLIKLKKGSAGGRLCMG